MYLVFVEYLLEFRFYLIIKSSRSPTEERLCKLERFCLLCLDFLTNEPDSMIEKNNCEKQL